MPQSMIVQGIDHVAINVRDMEAMTAFYSEILGCSVERRREAAGLVHLRAGNTLIDLIDSNGPLGRATPAGYRNRLNHLCLTASDFDAKLLRETFISKGVAVGAIKERYGSTGVSRTLYFRDPENNGLELRAAGGIDGR